MQKACAYTQSVYTLNEESYLNQGCLTSSTGVLLYGHFARSGGHTRPHRQLMPNSAPAIPRGPAALQVLQLHAEAITTLAVAQ